jgi:maltose/moltooligosaccharide transporter
MPYAILAGALPPNKMGFYMGVFNFFIVIPQIVAAAILGFFVNRVFHNQSIYALVVGGCSMIVAGIMNLLVREKGDETPKEIVEEVMISEQTPPSYI